MTKLFEQLREYKIPGWFWALMLAILIRGVIWSIYIWLRSLLAASTRPVLIWAVCIVYFAFWVWLFALLIRNGKPYRGMIADAFLGGGLLTVAGVLHDIEAISLLAGKGFEGATWIVVLGACGLIIRISLMSPRGPFEEMKPPASS
jgi:hypothetical protein